MKRRDEPCAWLGLALVGALVLLLALPGASTAKLRARSLTTSQASILDHGFKIKLVNTGRADKVGRVRVRTRTFDDSARKPLTKPKRVHVDARSKRRVRLRLTPRGRDAVTACGARELLVEFKGSVKRRGQLRRTSDGCRPGPVDLSRAGDCDFIGQQEGSLCMLPFPDDFYTVADPSTATGRRIDFDAAAMPANGAGTPIAPGPYNLNDGFSPGQSIVLKVPGLDTPAALAQTDPVQLNHLGRYAEPDAPVVVDRRGHRRALADLGRARLQRREPGRHRADDQPGGQLRRRASLHRRPARPEDAGRLGDIGAARLPLLPRRAAQRLGGDQRAAAALRVDLRGLARCRDPALEPLPRVGLHGRQRREHRRADAAHPRRRLRDPRRHDDGRHGRPGRLAGVQRRPRSTTSPPARTRTSPAASAGPTPSPATCIRTASRAAVSCSAPTASRAATATTRRSSTASSRGSRSTGRRRSRCARRFTATACSDASRGSATATRTISQTTTASSSARPTRSAWPPRTFPTRSGSSATSPTSRSSPTACSRAC